MKLRVGFVSNSSSSSFIISSPNKRMKSTKISIPVDLNQYVYHTASTEEELLRWFKDNYYDDMSDIENVEDSWSKRTFLKCLEEIKQGRTVHFGSASDECTSPEETFLCYNGFKGVDFDEDVQVIEGEGGY